MNLRALSTLALATLPVLLVAACGSDEPEGRVIKPISSQAAPEPGAPSPQPAPGPGMPQAGGRLALELPEGWVEEPPANTMRQAQARITGAGGDGEFALFYFGPGGGGGVEANIQRWLAQVEPAAGGQPVRETFQVDDLTVHTVEAQGTLTASPMTMQGGDPEPQPGQMLLGAVVEGPGGPWFLKATGPAATLEPYRDEFFAMVRAVELL
jgi:hypothetical protein